LARLENHAISALPSLVKTLICEADKLDARLYVVSLLAILRISTRVGAGHRLVAKSLADLALYCASVASDGASFASRMLEQQYSYFYASNQIRELVFRLGNEIRSRNKQNQALNDKSLRDLELMDDILDSARLQLDYIKHQISNLESASEYSVEMLSEIRLSLSENERFVISLSARFSRHKPLMRRIDCDIIHNEAWLLAAMLLLEFIKIQGYVVRRFLKAEANDFEPDPIVLHKRILLLLSTTDGVDFEQDLVRIREGDLQLDEARLAVLGEQWGLEPCDSSQYDQRRRELLAELPGLAAEVVRAYEAGELND
jgi:hypothetical protein